MVPKLLKQTMKPDYTNTSSEQSNMAAEPAVAYVPQRHAARRNAPHKTTRVPVEQGMEDVDVTVSIEPTPFVLSIGRKIDLSDMPDEKEAYRQYLKENLLADIHTAYNDAEDLSPLPEGKEAYTLEEFRDILISDLKETYGVNNEVHV